MSNAGDIPTLNVDDSAVRDAQETSPAEQSIEPTASTCSETAPNSLAPPEKEAQSLVQPGRLVFNSQLPPELGGSLTTIGKKKDGGQFADIFFGVWENTSGSKTKVAIKCIRLESRAELTRWKLRIRREVVIWQAANHPNILQFIGYKVVDGIPWLVSPWCEHSNLLQYVTTQKRITEAEKLKLLCDAGHGLEHLHSLTPLIIHGDIKPTNVLIKDNLEAALCDFGLSRVFLGLGAPSGLSTTGNKTGGTAGYQAKELLDRAEAKGEISSTTAGDLYAFGGLILATMSGKQPLWRKKNEYAKIVAVCMGEISLPEDHPKLPNNDPLWDLIRECWSDDPTKRPPMGIILEKLKDERDRRSVPKISAA